MSGRVQPDNGDPDHTLHTAVLTEPAVSRSSRTDRGVGLALLANHGGSVTGRTDRHILKRCCSACSKRHAARVAHTLQLCPCSSVSVVLLLRGGLLCLCADGLRCKGWGWPGCAAATVRMRSFPLDHLLTARTRVKQCFQIAPPHWCCCCCWADAASVWEAADLVLVETACLHDRGTFVVGLTVCRSGCVLKDTKSEFQTNPAGDPASKGAMPGAGGLRDSGL
jgi:hypothetical protein